MTARLIAGLLLIAFLIYQKRKKAVPAPKGSKTPTPTKPKVSELTSEQRERIVNAILEDSLLENNSVYDALMWEGEALYPAAAACKCEAREFELQYGSKPWTEAWAKALAMWFDCQSEYSGNGMFRMYGKEA